VALQSKASSSSCLSAPHGRAAERAAPLSALHRNLDVMGQLRGTRRKRKLEELSLDEFLDGGFALAGGGGAQPEGAERATRASPPAGSEAVQHRAQLDALRERDPDFYAYLQQTDAELLRFGEGGEGSGGGSDGAAPGSASDEQPPVAAPVAGDGSKPAPAEPARDATEGARGAACLPAGAARAPPPLPPLRRPPARAGKGGGVVTAALIDRWCQDARATCSYRAMRNLLRVRPPAAPRRAAPREVRAPHAGRAASRARAQAYRFACHYGESEEDVDAALRITSVAAMDRLVKFMLDEVRPRPLPRWPGRGRRARAAPGRRCSRGSAGRRHPARHAGPGPGCAAAQQRRHGVRPVSATPPRRRAPPAAAAAAAAAERRAARAGGRAWSCLRARTWATRCTCSVRGAAPAPGPACWGGRVSSASSARAAARRRADRGRRAGARAAAPAAVRAAAGLLRAPAAQVPAPRAGGVPGRRPGRARARVPVRARDRAGAAAARARRRAQGAPPARRPPRIPRAAAARCRSGGLTRPGAQGVTRAFMAGARFVSAGSAPHIAFMGACVIELHGLDPAAAYEHAFLAVRGLAGVLRGALSNKTKDAFRSVYCWQTVAALELWARLLAAHAGAGPLAPLAFPVAQLLTGAARLVPSARYLPLRLRLLRALVRLGAAMRLAVPAAPALLDLLAWPALLKSARPAPAAAGGPAAARPPGLLLRASRAALAAPAFQADVVEQALELLAGHLAAWACAPGFPELAHVPLLRLRRFAAGTPVERFRAGARGLIAALEANAAWAAAARGAAGFAPGDAAAVAGFLAAEDAAGAVRAAARGRGLCVGAWPQMRVGGAALAQGACLMWQAAVDAGGARCTPAPTGPPARRQPCAPALTAARAGPRAGAAAEVCGAAGGARARAARSAGRRAHGRPRRVGCRGAGQTHARGPPGAARRRARGCATGPGAVGCGAARRGPSHSRPAWRAACCGMLVGTAPRPPPYALRMSTVHGCRARAQHGQSPPCGAVRLRWGRAERRGWRGAGGRRCKRGRGAGRAALRAVRR